MPYLAHFGLTDHPFTLTPNLDYYFPTQDNANIIASLEFALRRDSGIIKIVGEVGTGKTLLCRLLISKLVDTDKVAYINAPQADSRTIIRTVCDEFGVDPGPEDGSPYAALNRFLLETHEKGKLAVVVVDEAQHLGRDGLEAIRLISNLETEKNKLLQIVLFGQTELDDLLRQSSLRQLAQRVVFSFNTQPLTASEAKRYVAHRIRVSRRAGIEYALFSEAALDIIARHSGGTPRVVNILADKSLLVAYSEGSPTVQRAHAREAVRDTPGIVVGQGRFAGVLPIGWKPLAWTSVGLLGIAAALAAGTVAWRAAQRPAAQPVSAVAPGSPVVASPVVTSPVIAVAAAPASAPSPDAPPLPAPATETVQVAAAASPPVPPTAKKASPRHRHGYGRHTAETHANSQPPASPAPVAPDTAPAPVPVADGKTP